MVTNRVPGRGPPCEPPFPVRGDGAPAAPAGQAASGPQQPGPTGLPAGAALGRATAPGGLRGGMSVETRRRRGPSERRPGAAGRPSALGPPAAAPACARPPSLRPHRVQRRAGPHARVALVAEHPGGPSGSTRRLLFARGHRSPGSQSQGTAGLHPVTGLASKLMLR